MFGYNNVELIKQNECCLDSFGSARGAQTR